MERLQHIVVATDFSETSRAAEATAITLARAFGANLHWFHAVDIPYLTSEAYGTAIPPALIEGVREEASKRLEERSEQARKAGVACTCCVGSGGAARATVAFAEEVGGDLIVLGTDPSSTLRRLFLGSVAERTVQTAACSVMVARGAGDAPTTIVVGTDFSEAAKEALAAAAALARRTKAKLHIVHALELAVPFVTPYSVSVPNPVISAAVEQTRTQLAEIEATLDVPSGVSSEVISEPAAAALVDAAQVRNAELIVTGTRGLTGLKHLFLGSVAERTLRRASCSVWAVHAGDWSPGSAG